jgi:hypothetical protein
VASDEEKDAIGQFVVQKAQGSMMARNAYNLNVGQVNLPSIDGNGHFSNFRKLYLLALNYRIL